MKVMDTDFLQVMQRRDAVRSRLRAAAVVVGSVLVAALLVYATYWTVSRENACDRKGGAWIQGHCLQVHTIEVP